LVGSLSGEGLRHEAERFARVKRSVTGSRLIGGIRMTPKCAVAVLSLIAIPATAADRLFAQGPAAQSQQSDEDRGKSERAKAAREREKQREERARTEQSQRDRARAEQQKQRQERARGEQERARAAQEKARAEQERSVSAKQKQGDERARVDEDRLKQERAKLDRDRVLIEQERSRLETERARADEVRQKERSARAKGEMERRDKRLKEEENRLKAGEDQLRQREEYQRTRQGALREHREELRDRDQRLDRAERRLERLEDIQKHRRERVEAGRRILEEPDRRYIVKDQTRVVIRHDETERLRKVTRDFRTERRRDGITVAYFTRPDGSRVISEVDDNGRLLRRYRRTREGREIVLIDNRRSWRPDRPQFFFDEPVSLPPLRLAIPRERYIVEYSRASDDDLYDALIAPPVERLSRRYSLEEVRWSHPLRERMRRVDLDDINFEFGSWEITPDQMPKLERLASVIKRVLDRQPNEVFLIEGHTDAVGSEEDNLSLSDRRAEAVATTLTQTFDVPPENLVTQGYGEQSLKVQRQEAERGNRRVSIRRITPLLSQDSG
jgi:outer membrane protein OmpA-like peptidoglycan-associated protein